MIVNLLSHTKTTIFTVMACCIFTAACTASVGNPVSLEDHVIRSIPIYPVNDLKMFEGQAIQLTVPISTTGYTIVLIEYRTPEDTSYITSTENIFPTDVYISVLPGVEIPKVFLGRSPQSGCPIEWRWDSRIYKAYCDGSEFKIDGTYISGPSPRNLDEFPVSIQGGMIWITNTVIVGSPSVR